MSRPVIDQARALALASRIHEAESAKESLIVLLEPLAKSEARHLNVKAPGHTLSEVEGSVRQAMLRGAIAWRHDGGMNLTSLLKRCARNAVFDLARRSMKTAGDVGEELLEGVADGSLPVDLLDVSSAIALRFSKLAKEPGTRALSETFGSKKGDLREATERAYRSVAACLLAGRPRKRTAVICKLPRQIVTLIAEDLAQSDRRYAQRSGGYRKRAP